MNQQPTNNLLIQISGSAAFRSRLNSIFEAQIKTVWRNDCSPQELWGKILSQKPNIILFEIGYLYDQREHEKTRTLLHEVRERFNNALYIIPIITDPEKLYFAGDLLFKDPHSLEPSDYIDSFLVSPPVLELSLPPIQEQLLHLLPLVSAEFLRRERGDFALPPLNTHGWIQSLAAPESKELWMKWVPKYASYSEENPLIIGATGTGKTNLARALHIFSGRKGKFVSITPRDFSSSELVQAELFGSVAGAYTGAVEKWGLVKSAEGGTLFIDELQSIDKELQGKLITFIENKAYRRVGSSEQITADVRFVFASNRDLYTMMHDNVLRDDFAYRLERVLLELKPLNERKLDIPAAFAYALAKIKRQRGLLSPIYGITKDGFKNLFAQKWPGNLRQLENAVAKMCEKAEMNNQQLITESITREVQSIKTQNIAFAAKDVFAIAARDLSYQVFQENHSTINQVILQFKENIRITALNTSGGDKEKAAELIGDNKQLIELTAQSILTKAHHDDQNS